MTFRKPFKSGGITVRPPIKDALKHFSCLVEKDRRGKPVPILNDVARIGLCELCSDEATDGPAHRLVQLNLQTSSALEGGARTAAYRKQAAVFEELLGMLGDSIMNKNVAFYKGLMVPDRSNLL
jgi:hypothetical protein